jgi:hypothetical protein
VRQRKGLFLAPESVVRQRQGRPAHIGGGGDREASSHGCGIDEECFINKMFCLHRSKLFIGIFMNKIFCLPNIWKTCACCTCILLSIPIKNKKIERGEIKKEKEGKYGHSSMHNMARKI